jgi:insulysin
MTLNKVRDLISLFHQRYANMRCLKTAQHDAANAKLLTKAEMLEFFDKYFSPSSSSRARLSVHLYARGSSELDSKLVGLLKNLGLDDVPKESRASLDLLEGHLKTGQSIPDDQRASLLSQAKELGLPQASPKAETSSDEAAAIDAAIEITDGRQYKAGLQVSSGARPVKDLKEFEEIDPKL